MEKYSNNTFIIYYNKMEDLSHLSKVACRVPGFQIPESFGPVKRDLEFLSRTEL